MTSAHLATARHARRAFYLRRLHSLSGVLPVGVFLVEHLWTNAAALAGQGSFDRAVARIQSIPFLPLVEVFGILLPLAFHALYGLVIAREARVNAPAYPYGRNWLYVLQRISGVVILAFVLGHLWELRVQKWLFGMGSAAFYGKLEQHLSWTWAGVPWIALGYLVGIAASVFHLANGLVGFCVTWGITTSRAAQRRAGAAFGALGVVLFLLAWGTVFSLATGTRLLPEADEGKSRSCGPAASIDGPPASP